MAKRRQSGGAPLEWVAVRVSRAAAASITIARENFDLNLDDDEVAEIHGIDSTIIWIDPALTADVNQGAESALVMDPSYPTTGTSLNTEAVQEDLEVFFGHRSQLKGELTTSGHVLIDLVVKKQLWFAPKPLLLATNPALLTINTDSATINAEVVYIVRLYFTRKKAGRDDLTRILLKRR